MEQKRWSRRNWRGEQGAHNAWWHSSSSWGSDWRGHNSDETWCDQVGETKQSCSDASGNRDQRPPDTSRNTWHTSVPDDRWDSNEAVKHAEATSFSTLSEADALQCSLPEEAAQRHTCELNPTKKAVKEAQHWQQALESCEQGLRRSLHVDVHSYHAAIDACERRQHWQGALRLLQEMPSKSLEPDVPSFTAAISACEKGGQWQLALELLGNMRCKGLEPDIATYGAVADTCLYTTWNSLGRSTVEQFSGGSKPTVPEPPAQDLWGAYRKSR